MAKSLSIIAALVGIVGAGISVRGAMIRGRDFADVRRQCEWATLAALAGCVAAVVNAAQYWL